MRIHISYHIGLRGGASAETTGASAETTGTSAETTGASAAPSRELGVITEEEQDILTSHLTNRLGSIQFDNPLLPKLLLGIEQDLEPVKGETINIIFLHCGECVSEFQILAHLVANGFTIGSVILNDTPIRKADLERQLQPVCEIMKTRFHIEEFVWIDAPAVIKLLVNKKVDKVWYAVGIHMQSYADRIDLVMHLRNLQDKYRGSHVNPLHLGRAYGHNTGKLYCSIDDDKDYRPIE